jgi:hypothetical protein
LLAADEPSFAAALDQMAPKSTVPGLGYTNSSIRNSLELARPVDKWDARTQTNVARSLGYVEQIRRLLESKQARLVVTLMPFAWNVSRDEMKIGRRLYRFGGCDIPIDPLEMKIRDYCRDREVDYVDLINAFKKYPSRDDARLFFPNDGHWSDTGQAVVADAIFASLNAPGSKSALH